MLDNPKPRERWPPRPAAEPRKDGIEAPVYILYGFFSIFGVCSLVALLRLRHRVRRWPLRNQSIRQTLKAMIVLILLHELVIRWGMLFFAGSVDRTTGQVVFFIFYPFLEILWFIITLAALYAPDFRRTHGFRIVRNISMIYLIPCFIYSGLLIMLFIATFPSCFE